MTQSENAWHTAQNEDSLGGAVFLHNLTERQKLRPAVRCPAPGAPSRHHVVASEGATLAPAHPQLLEPTMAPKAARGPPPPSRLTWFLLSQKVPCALEAPEPLSSPPPQLHPRPQQILLGRQKYTSCCLGTGNAFFTLSGKSNLQIVRWRTAAVEVFCSSLSRGNRDFKRDVGSHQGTPAHADQRPGCARRGPWSRYLDFSTVGDQGRGLLGTPHLVTPSWIHQDISLYFPERKCRGGGNHGLYFQCVLLSVHHLVSEKLQSG